jgi:hypothetical protein
MSTRILAITAAALAVVFSSCRPIGDPPKEPQPPVKKLTAEEEAKKKEEEARKKAEEELKQKEEEAKRQAGDGTTIPGSGDTVNPPPPPVDPVRRDYPFANKVPGKDGFVFSPYNNKVVDVRDIPSGTLVQDPTYPAAEKKYFRVP